MNKRRKTRETLILTVLALTILSILTACSIIDRASEPAPLSVTALGVKENAKPPLELPSLLSTETPTEPQTEAPTEPQTAPPTETPTESLTEAPTERVVHVAVQLDTSDIVPDYAAEMIGRTIWGEAGGIQSEAERAAVAWCVLNRVDAWGLTVEQVITQPGQFHGYRDAANWGECPPEHLELAEDVLYRWASERYDVDYTGRVLPPEYLFFWGDGVHNYFSTEYQGTDYWDWSLTNPYI